MKMFINFIFFLAVVAAGGDLRINEFMASNKNAHVDPDTDTYPDWIEIYNSGSSLLNISGYGLNDTIDPVLAWKFPAGTTIPPLGYILVYADDLNYGLHTDFKLSSKGEMVALFDPSGAILDTVSFGVQITDASFGLDSLGEWKIFYESTPGEENSGSSAITGKCSMPVFSIIHPILSIPQVLSITSAEPDVKIYYTTDGTAPDSTSVLYTEPISIKATTAVKAVAYGAPGSGKVPSEMASRTYLFNVDHDLDIMTLTSDNDTVNSSNKRVIDGRVFVEFILKNDSLAISQYAEFKASGYTSKNVPQLNGKLTAKKKYGKDNFKFKFYPNKELDKFNSILLRNASQDWHRTHFRDALVSRIISTDSLVDMPFEGYRPVVVYKNGLYEGILNIREDDDKDYVKHNYGITGNILKTYPEAHSDYHSYDLSTESGVASYKDFIAVDQLYFYYGLLSYTGSDEWGGKIWRDSVAKSQFQFYIHDFDPSFALIRDDGGTYWDYGIRALGSIGDIVEKNSDEKNEMLQFFASQISILYNPDRTLKILDNMVTELRDEIPAHAVRNVELHSEVNGSPKRFPFKDLAEWEAEVSIVRDFLKARCDTLWRMLKDEYSISTYKLTLLSSKAEEGFIKVHDIKSLKQEHTGRFISDIPVRLKAVPRDGYHFSHWEGALNSTDNSISLILDSDTSVKAVFVPALVTSMEDHKKLGFPLGITSVSKKFIKISIPKDGVYDLSVFLLNGRLVMRVKDEFKKGNNYINWDGGNIAKGMLITKISNANGSASIRKFLR